MPIRETRYTGLSQILLLGIWLGSLLTGCTSAATAPVMGYVRLGLTASRQIQYVASQIQSMQVTLTSVTTCTTYVQNLNAQDLTGGRFSFQAMDLPVGTYTARLDVYLDSAQTLLGGTSTSSTFTVNSGETTAVTFPSLILAPTPVGSWTIASNIHLGKGYHIENYQYALTETDGTIVTHASRNGTAAWSNIVCFPVGISTTSVTVEAKKGLDTFRKTAIATVSVQAGKIVTSSVNLSLP